MRKTFQKWLFVFVFIAFVVTLLISFFIQTRQSWQHSEALIFGRIADAREQVERNTANLEIVLEGNRATALTKARVLAQMTQDNPVYMTDQQALQALVPIINADELHVIDAAGFIVNSSDASLIGYNMASAEQSEAFLKLLGLPGAELVQQPVARGADGKIMQYAGVVVNNGKAIVQIGYHPDRLAESMKLADIKNLAPSLRIGEKGLLAVLQDDVIVSDGDRGFIGKTVEELELDPTIFNDGKAHYIKLGDERYMCAIERYNDCVIAGMLPENEIYTTRKATIDFLVVSNIVVFITVFALVSLLVQREVINGIYEVNDSLTRITDGDLDEQVDVRMNNEFCTLSDGINSTVDALKTAITEAAARIDEELEFARAIQYGSVPNVFPPYPDRKEFDVFASMHSAKEVGGDFYDFFIIGGKRLGFVIADVSGKGIGAALFMMSAKTQIKNHMLAGSTLDSIITDVNQSLCEGNDTGMFVTAFAGVIDFERARLTYVNAGHNPPLIRHPGGEYLYMGGKRGLVLGAMGSVRYRTNEVPLFPGDTLLLYTDGVTEAINPAVELYGEERFIRFLNQPDMRNADVTTLLNDIYSEVERFRDTAEQADDITLLGVDVHSVENGETRIILPATVERLSDAVDFVSEALAKHDIPQKTITQAAISVDELFTNIANYAYPDRAGLVSVACSVQPDAFSIELSDFGRPYDPLAKADPDVTLSAEDREIGGLGIFLAKKLMDDFTYRYENGLNRVVLTKKL